MNKSPLGRVIKSPRARGGELCGAAFAVVVTLPSGDDPARGAPAGPVGQLALGASLDQLVELPLQLLLAERARRHLGAEGAEQAGGAAEAQPPGLHPCL